MKRTTKIISAVVLTLGLATGATAYAKYNSGFGEAQAAFMVSYIGSELSLNESQQKQLEVLSDKIIAVKSTFQAQGKPLHSKLKNLLEADKFDQQQILAMINQKTELVNQEAPAILAALADFLDNLNPEQKAEVIQFIEDKKSRHGRGWMNH